MPPSGSLIAAGPLTKQRGSEPYRIVLIVHPDGTYSVHHEGFEKIPEPGEQAKSHLYWGHYFAKYDLERAVRVFGEKVAEQSSYMNHLEEEK